MPLRRRREDLRVKVAEISIDLAEIKKIALEQKLMNELIDSNVEVLPSLDQNDETLN